jgi:regulatory protein
MDGCMAGKITALEYQKKNRNRVSVYLDDRFAFGVPAIVATRLARGQYLSDAEIESIQDQGDVETAYHKALDYLSYRPRSRAEVTTYLKKRGLPEGQIEDIAERLERASLLDDEVFAQFWVENRERFRPKGLRALRYELRLKGISYEIIEQALASVDVSAGAYRSASKKARQVQHLDQREFHRKIVEYLARRGFDYEVAREAAERHWTERTEANGSPV